MNGIIHDRTDPAMTAINSRQRWVTLMPFMVIRRLGILIALRRILKATVNQLAQIFTGSSRWCQLDCRICTEPGVSFCFLALIDYVVRFQLLDHEVSLLLLVKGHHCGIRVQGR